MNAATGLRMLHPSYITRSAYTSKLLPPLVSLFVPVMLWAEDNRCEERKEEDNSELMGCRGHNRWLAVRQSFSKNTVVLYSSFSMKSTLLAFLVGMRKWETSTHSSITRHSVHIFRTQHIALTSAPKDPTYRCCLETVQTLSEFSIEVPSIVIDHKPGIISENNDWWRTGTHLVTIVNLCLRSVSSSWRRLPQNSITQYLVEN